MKHNITTIIFALVITCVAYAQTAKPDFTGTWERVSFSGAGNPGAETLKIVHNEPYFYVLYRIKDGAGERTLDLKAIVDGKPHKQETEGRPATFIARWEGAQLVLDIRREASFGISHTLRKMLLSADGKTMTTERNWFTAEGGLRKETGTEKWERR